MRYYCRVDHFPEFAQFVPASAQAELRQMAQGLPLGQLAFVDQVPAQFALDFLDFLVNGISLVHELVDSLSHDLHGVVPQSPRKGEDYGRRPTMGSPPSWSSGGILRRPAA